MVYTIALAQREHASDRNLSLISANFYLENMIDLVNEDLDSRIVQYLNQSPENG